MEREEADEGREGRVVHAPALEEPVRELEALPPGEERLREARARQSEQQTVGTRSLTETV